MILLRQTLAEIGGLDVEALDSRDPAELLGALDALQLPPQSRVFEGTTQEVL